MELIALQTEHLDGSVCFGPDCKDELLLLVTVY